MPVDVPAIERLGIKCIIAQSDPLSIDEPRYNATLLENVLQDITKERSLN